MKENPSLLFDIGNTRLKWGLYRNRRIARTGSLTHEHLHETGYAALTQVLPRQVERVFASNVAGIGMASRLSALVGLHCNSEVRFVRSQANAFGVTNSYRRPRSMGVDRWVAMIGAYAEFHSALCIVDAGTAVTIDAVDKSGRHHGGQISAGLNLMTSALRAETSDIKSQRVSTKAPGEGMQVFASTTENAVSFGSFAAISGAIERAVRTLRSAGFRPKIVLTGGDASRILKQLDVKCLHRPNLVLQGLAHMIESDL